MKRRKHYIRTHDTTVFEGSRTACISYLKNSGLWKAYKAGSNAARMGYYIRETCDKFDDFTRGFIACALWSSNDERDVPLDQNYSGDDIAPESLKAIATECAKFQQENAPLPDYNRPGETGEDSAAAYAGHDFWLTRNGHGAGFFDREELSEEDQKRLTEASKRAGECYLYVGDDGQLHFSKC